MTKIMDVAAPDETSVAKKLDVAVLGSCRVHNPIKDMQELGKVEYTKSAPIRFVHNPLEILDALNILKGQLTVPPHLMPMSCQARALTRDRSFENTMGLADVVVCEISSVRIAEYEKTQFQINLLRQFLVASGLSPAGVKALYSNQEDGPRETVDDPLARSILAKGSFYELSTDQITAALQQIVDEIDKPILFVGFINELRDGGMIAQRTIVNDTIATFTATNPMTQFFNPTELIAQYGFETVVKDMGHYKEDFVPTVGEVLIERVQSFYATLAD